MKKFFRAGDAYVKFQSIRPVYLKDIRVLEGLPVLLPSTRLYRPWKPSYPVQNKFKLRRILNEMTEAARNNAYYHIWWHPHNFGYHPQQCLQELESIIRHYVSLRNKYGFETLTMNEITELIKG
jgi:hypothetical protein